eukprot:14215740-Ditylum_brightwellii.AAC.1
MGVATVEPTLHQNSSDELSNSSSDSSRVDGNSDKIKMTKRNTKVSVSPKMKLSAEHMQQFHWRPP